MVARIFGIDPVLVLTETDPMRTAVRVAATQFIVEQENEANKQANKRKG